MLNVSNIFFQKKKSQYTHLMPPKKITTKGAKGKAKAQNKEEKKQAKNVKPVDKGMYWSPYSLIHTIV